MKLYAVVVGKKRVNKRYVAFHPQFERHLVGLITPLAVFDNKKNAQKAKQKILDDCGHTDIYVITFTSKE